MDKDIINNEKQKKKSKKGIIIGVIAAIIIIAAVAGGTSGSGNEKNKDKDVVKIDKTTGGDNKGSEDTKDDNGFATIGEMVKGDKWNIALLDVKEYDKIEGEYYTEEPESGKVYLVSFLEAENVSGKDDYFNNFYFVAFADDYKIDNFTIIFNEPDGYSAIGGDVYSGKKTKGYIVYEVPKDWKTFELTYDDGIWTSKKACEFKVTKEQVSK